MLDAPPPLLSELTALHAALSRHQHDLTQLSAQLAEKDIAAARAVSRATVLSHANQSLQSEVHALRAAARNDADLLALPSKQWSITLRRATDKFDHLESTLRLRLLDLHAANAARYKASIERDEALGLLRRIQDQRQDDLHYSREIERSLNLVREEKAMMDLAMSDYADLVRSLTAQAPDRSTPSRTLSQGLSGLSRLFSEHASENDSLQARISLLQSELDQVKIELLPEQDYHSQIHATLVNCEAKCALLEADDSAAAKVVSRYMKFSQESTNALQQALLGLRSRHAATVETLESQLSVLQQTLTSEEVAHEHTQRMLTEAQSELLYEQASLRREVSLRIKSMDQMARLLDLLERVSGKYRPVLNTLSEDNTHDLHALLAAFLNDIERLGTDFGQLEGSHGKMLYDYIDLLQEQYQLHTPEPDITLAASPSATTTRNNDVPTQLVASIPAATSDKGVQHVLPSDDGHDQDSLPRALPVLSKGEANTTPASPEPHTSQVEEIPEGSTVVTPPRIVELLNIDAVNQDESVTKPGESSELASNPLPPSVESGFGQSEETGIISQGEAGSAKSFAFSIPVSDPVAPEPPSLLKQLGEVTARYDGLQKSLYACHLAIQKLKQDFNETETSDLTATFDPPTLKQFKMISNRLDDYNEDTRVELEIAIADEGRAAQGFMALALLPSDSDASLQGDSSWKDDVATFLSEEYPPFKSVSEIIQRKLDDIKHDLGILQEHLHHRLAKDGSTTTEETHHASGWASWTNGVLSPSSSRPASPSRSPSFGTVISARSSRQHLYPGLAPDSSLDLSALGLRVSNTVAHQLPTPSTSSFPGRLFGANRASSFGVGLSRNFSPLSRRPTPMVATPPSRHGPVEVEAESTDSEAADVSDVE